MSTTERMQSTATHEREKENVDGFPNYSACVRRVVEQVGPHNDCPAQKRVVSAEKIRDFDRAPSRPVYLVMFVFSIVQSGRHAVGTHKLDLLPDAGQGMSIATIALNR